MRAVDANIIIVDMEREPVTKKGKRAGRKVKSSVGVVEPEEAPVVRDENENVVWMMSATAFKMVLQLSEGRSIRVTKNLIVLEDEVQNKFAAFNFQKFCKIVGAIDEIDATIEKMKKMEEEDVNLRVDIGGKWYVTMTSGMKCVDIRRWIVRDGHEFPSRTGMALRFAEWEMFKKRVKTIHSVRADIASVVPCYMQGDHHNQLGK